MKATKGEAGYIQARKKQLILKAVPSRRINNR